MAVQKGQSGVIQIVTVGVAHLTSYEFETTVDAVETTAMGDVAKSYVGGLTDGTFSCVCQWDASDAGQEDIRDGLAAGTTITVNVYPTGVTTAGAKYYTGSILITSSKVSASMGDGLVESSFSGNGQLALGTVGS